MKVLLFLLWFCIVLCVCVFFVCVFVVVFVCFVLIIFFSLFLKFVLFVFQLFYFGAKHFCGDASAEGSFVHVGRTTLEDVAETIALFPYRTQNRIIES